MDDFLQLGCYRQNTDIYYSGDGTDRDDDDARSESGRSLTSEGGLKKKG